LREKASTSPGNDFGWAPPRLDGVELMLNTALGLSGTYAQGVDVEEPTIRHYGMKQL
jgi:hypothetical protein